MLGLADGEAPCAAAAVVALGALGAGASEAGGVGTGAPAQTGGSQRLSIKGDGLCQAQVMGLASLRRQAASKGFL